MTTRFTLNFVNRTIVGTKASFDKASKGSGSIYEELVSLMARHPDFGVEIKEQEKHSTTPKQTYKGLTITLIKEYIEIQKDGEKLLNTFEAVLDYGEACDAKYPMAKRWFCENFKDITAEDMRKAITNHYYNDTLATVSAENAAAEAKSEEEAA